MASKRMALCALVAAALCVAGVQTAWAGYPHESKNIGADVWDDLAVMYNYGGGKVGLFAFESSVPSPGSYRTTPRKLWQSVSGWDGVKVTPLIADATGDYHADVVSVYAYNSSTTGLFVTPGSGGTSTSSLWWKSSAWAPSKTKWTTARSLSGAVTYNPVALYNYGNNTSGIWDFAASAGSFVPSRIWKSPTGGWSWARSKVAGGDFNLDGKGDLAILYDYGNNTTGLWLFRSNGTGYTRSRIWLSPAGGWNWSRSQLYAADVDGDMYPELFVPYTRTNDTKFFVFQPNQSGKPPALQNWGTSVYTFFDDIPMTMADMTHDWMADIVLWGPGDSDLGVSMEMLPSKGSSFETELLNEVYNDSDPAHWNYVRTKLAR